LPLPIPLNRPNQINAKPSATLQQFVSTGIACIDQMFCRRETLLGEGLFHF